MKRDPNDYPKFVVYLKDDEAEKVRLRAKRANFTKPQKWIAHVVRQKLGAK